MSEFIFALIPWLGQPIGYFFLDKEQDLLEQYLANLSDIGLLGIAASIIGLVVTGGGWLTVLDHKFTTFLAGLGLAVDFLCLTVFPHTESIAAWFKANGLLGNAVYLAILLAVIFVNRKSVQTSKMLQGVVSSVRIDRRGETEQFSGKVDGKEISIPVKSLLGPLLIVPSIVLYIYDGMADIDTEHMSRLTPDLDILHWNFAIKISCVLFVILVLKYFLPILRHKSPLGWTFLAFLLDLAALSFAYVLLERALYPISMEGLLTRVFIYIPMLVISGFFHLYAYIYFLYCLFEFFAPGAFREWRLTSEAAALAKARADLDRGTAEMEKKLDAEERLLNALGGIGPYTEEEALSMGKISTEEYLPGKVYRDQKLNK